MSDWRVPGFTSTGSKRPDALFGSAAPDEEAGLPTRMVRAAGCRVWDAGGREYVDYVMALGAVALGYGHPEVNRAAEQAIAAGVAGPLPPTIEEELAEALAQRIPWLERLRFLKTGAEAVAAAVRLARVATGRDRVLGCGYHGWLDWCQGAEGVPAATRALYAEIPFNDVDATRRLIREVGQRLAVVVIEPVIVAEPTREWLDVVRRESTRVGAVLVFDEIKTAFRLAVGGAAERYGIRPDLAVLGKALANGFPLAVVGGRADLMAGAARTWISSTLATEGVALAAAQATLAVMVRDQVCAHLHRVGTRLWHGLHRLHHEHPDLVTGVGGLAEMCFLHFASEAISRAVARGAAARGLLLKRTAYNFVSLAHDDAVVDHTLAVLDDVLRTAVPAA
ncbi:MAG TPA: aminotransferase class III-fold pyridoxal phosphate-dependent enzyme [Gemmatimonadales bacterium]|nr:aminotransferase class III-fold pyridoxal phosphate-dependent enzyme [Gemmatimonadales bacterium]